MLAIEMGEYYKGGARARVVQKVEKQLLSYIKPELNVKPKNWNSAVGLIILMLRAEVINAIYNDKQAEHYVNIPHHGHIDNIPARLGGRNDLYAGARWRDATSARYAFR